MIAEPISTLPIVKINGTQTLNVTDELAVEEPLEIRLEYGSADQRITKNVSVTMRTPGNDVELATGFLFTEGIIKSYHEISDAGHCFIACAENKENVIQISLKPEVIPNLHNTERNFYTTSSCGVCGKGSINAIRTVKEDSSLSDTNHIDAAILQLLPQKLEQSQDVFSSTGGLHASALFDASGNLLFLREDVGRHNALDKLIGTALKEVILPLNKHILLLSGRASFELVQKAVMAGINIIAAVGAPSTLAVQLANEFNVTLIGFLRNHRFNIYTSPHRINIPRYENTH
ncbi:formate dehydrogenase accessory sulfurtransferase FdhD [Mucilaginibacter sp. KACC 22063]|uniref:formate dehydrogenase accessory sulfurtransferase FdhD n=1 Tax=Mucilaginibacter sp. KACC 22063 TaxID=3025666 RepID=UPI00236706F2|nr:formate dehydrogenase accessory sulfurtransferase FdhD [Mucilaginibacter sp. KACC 22063]WDF53424.1 formate dehydrogenase accessory sulfurtransferase FdhD [Mucilaginibacter sp. KACC 22063]